ncbi:MAG: hypothetical protein NTV05_15250 [Acidobacteria bacterium]|nr:hypothetical protein [Acidobacteriota bacterium]
MKRLVAVLVSAAFLGASAMAWGQERPAAQAGGKPNPIVGAWKLNKDLTDKPVAENARAGESGRRPSGMGGGIGGPGGRGGGGRRGGMGGGTGGGGYQGGRGGDPEQMKRMRTLLADLIRPADGWTIVQDGPLMLFTNVDGRTQKFTADGKEEEHLTGDGVIKSKTRWNGEQLIIEAKYQDGPKVTSTYTVSSDLRQLMIHIKVEGGGLPRELTTNHVFDRQADLR